MLIVAQLAKNSPLFIEHEHRVHKTPPADLINLINIFTSYFFKIHFKYKLSHVGT
jgi:hypothetical protein